MNVQRHSTFGKIHKGAQGAAAPHKAGRLVMARRHSDLVREAVIVLPERGFAADIDLGGRHCKVSWLQNGDRRLLVISKTPSSRYAAISSRATLQRLLREEAPS